MLLMLGDLHYSGHHYMSADQFKFAVHEVMKSEQMRDLYTTMPVRYMIDDHDAGANNANGLHGSTHQAGLGYSQIVPGAL